MMTVVLVGVFAGVGSVVRYLAGQLGNRLDKWGLPWGTYAVNIVGSFLIGFFFGEHLSDAVYKIAATGFCGGLTTFSTFNFELFSLLEQKKYRFFVAYFLLSYGIGLLACFLGILAGKIFA